MTQSRSHRPSPSDPHPLNRRFGVALSVGAARGMAHVGFLQELRECGYVPAAVAGASVGAAVGAVFCGGDIDAFAREMSRMNRKKGFGLLDPVFPRSGLMDGDRILKFIGTFLRVGTLEECDPPLAIIAACGHTGQKVVLDSGPILEAVRASLAVPGILRPGVINRTTLLDGGLVDPLPVRPCRELGAEVVIAVDAGAGVLERRANKRSATLRREFVREYASRLLPGDGEAGRGAMGTVLSRWLEGGRKRRTGVDLNIFEILLHSMFIMQRAVQEMQLSQDPPEALVTPDILAIKFLDFHKSRLAIEAGRETARTLIREAGGHGLLQG